MLAVVYHFEIYDPVLRAWARAEGMATLEAIERMGGVALRRTASTVDDGELRNGCVAAAKA